MALSQAPLGGVIDPEAWEEWKAATCANGETEETCVVLSPDCAKLEDSPEHYYRASMKHVDRYCRADRETVAKTLSTWQSAAEAGVGPAAQVELLDTPFDVSAGGRCASPERVAWCYRWRHQGPRSCMTYYRDDGFEHIRGAAAPEHVEYYCRLTTAQKLRRDLRIALRKKGKQARGVWEDASLWFQLWPVALLGAAFLGGPAYIVWRLRKRKKPEADG